MLWAFCCCCPLEPLFELEPLGPPLLLLPPLNNLPSLSLDVVLDSRATTEEDAVPVLRRLSSPPEIQLLADEAVVPAEVALSNDDLPPRDDDPDLN